MPSVCAKNAITGADEVGSWGGVLSQNCGSCCPTFLVVKFDSNGVTWLELGQWEARVTSVIGSLVGSHGSGVCYSYLGYVRQLGDQVFLQKKWSPDLAA